jgi:hypothetical protein
MRTLIRSVLTSLVRMLPAPPMTPEESILRTLAEIDTAIEEHGGVVVGDEWRGVVT